MDEAIHKVLRDNMAVKEGERVLIITDDGKADIAGSFSRVAGECGYQADLVTVPIPEVHGVEPPEEVAAKMLTADVVLAITTKSLSHTAARARATENGARIATMAGITEDILRRFSRVDLQRMKARTNALADMLDQAGDVLLSSRKGTELRFSIAGRIAHGRKASIFDKPGFWGNIPCGEAFIAPVESSVEGQLVIDASIASIGLVDADVVLQIDGGKVADVRGGSAAKRFASLLDDPRKRQVAEFGIGTNDEAAITGIMLEDEKATGTCHVAFGNNKFFGGTNEVGFHMDCVIRAPVIVLDGRPIA